MAAVSLLARIDAEVATFQKKFAEASRTAQRFEKDFGNAASSVSAQQRRINQAFESFSGDKIARDAAAVAKAVEQVGGASKLTAAEQSRVNTTVTEAIAKYSALGQTAPKSLIELEQATRKVEAATATVHRTTSIFGQSLASLEQSGTLSGRAMGVLTSTFGQFTAAGLAISLVSKLTGEIGRFVDQGVKLGPVQASFARLSEGVKVDSDRMLSSLQTATRGMVSNYDLMLASNKAMLLGLPVTADSMTELARTASVLGKAMGQDATKSFDDLITALGRSSPLILDNLGLTVKVEEANQKYAASLGKTADSLTDAEKKMAFYVEAMSKARERTRQIGEQTLTLGEIVQSVWTRVGNVVSGAISTINVQSGTMLSETAGAFSRIGSFLSSLAQNGVRGAIAMSLVNEQMARVVQAAATQAPSAAPAVEELTARARRLTAELGQLTTQQRESIRAGNELGLSNKEIAEALSKVAGTIKVTEQHLELLDRQAKNAAKSTGELKAVMDQITGADVVRQLRPWVDAIKQVGAAGQILADADLRKRLGSALDEVTRKFGSLKAAGLDSLRPISAALKAMGQQAETIPQPIIETIGVFSEVQSAGVNWLANLDKLNVSMHELIDSGKLFKEAFTPEDFKKLTDSMGRLAETTITLGDSFKNIALQTGHDITSIFADGIRSGDWSQFENDLRDGLSNAMGAGAAAAVDAFAPGLGQLLQPIFTALSDRLLGAFGLGTHGRDLVEEFAATFDNGFDGLRERLNELGAEGERLWVDLTQRVGRNNAEQARSAIEAIERALEAHAVKAMETEAQIAAARQRETDAIDAATAGVRSRIADLDSEYQSLFRSIENEAPEEVIGIIEAQARARMEAIKGERKTAESELDRITRQMEESFREVADSAVTAARIIKEAFSGMSPDGDPDSTSTTSGGTAKSFSFGGRSTAAVVPIGGGSAASAIAKSVPVNLYLDGELIATNTTNHQSRAMRRSVKVTAR